MILKKIIFFVFLFLNFFLINQLKAIENIKIVKRINNEIITNVDINNEFNYLKALNKNLQNLDQTEAIKISENSLIREKIKQSEINKVIKIQDFYKDTSNSKLLESIIRNIYTNLNIPNLIEFEKYLNQFEISLDDVKKKISIEVLWNQLISNKYKNQININKEALKDKIRKNNLTSKDEIEYKLSEIVFQVENQTELNEKINKIKKNIINIGFNTAANKFSISDTAKVGGLIGKVNESQLSEKIRKELKSINVGEFTKPINIGNRFVILYINEKNTINQKFDEDQILQTMIASERKRQYENFSQIYFDKIKLNIKIR